VSLFGMSISNAELPEMASQSGSNEAVAAALCSRLNTAMRRVAFFIIPSVAGFLALGDSIAALLYQTGKFTRSDAEYVWLVLAGSTVGLLASTLGRLYTSAFWALQDTRTPFRFASLRVVLTAGLGWLLAFPAPRWFGLDPRFGLVGLTASAGMAGWLEFTLLRRSMNRRIGKTGLQLSYTAKIWSIAITAAALSLAAKYWVTRGLSPLISGMIVLLIFGLVYFAGSIALRIPECLQLVEVLRKKSTVSSQ
jgi:putative peptidoglycan lipid II flippase